MAFHKNPWNSMALLRLPWIPWSSMDSMVFHGIHGSLWNLWTPWNSMDSIDSLELHGIHGIDIREASWISPGETSREPRAPESRLLLKTSQSVHLGSGSLRHE